MVSMSLTSYSSFLKENKLSTDVVNKQRIKNVGARISKAVEQYLAANGLQNQIANFEWEFNLVASNEPNAWCMPGGKVVFYEGILPYCQNDAGIAVVMGHEIAHAVAHHSNERMSQQALIQYGQAAATEILGHNQSDTRKAILAAAIGMGTNVGITLPFSRKHEYEADHLPLLTYKETQQWRDLGTKAGKFLADMTDFYIKAYETTSPHLGGCGLHDPLAVGVAVDPTLVTTLDINMKVDVEGPTRGRTIGDETRLNDPVKTMKVAVGVDVPRFLNEFMTRISGLAAKAE